MKPVDINKLNSDYIEIGSWLHSLSDSPDDFSLSYIIVLKAALAKMLGRVDDIADDLRNAGQ